LGLASGTVIEAKDLAISFANGCWFHGTQTQINLADQYLSFQDFGIGELG